VKNNLKISLITIVFFSVIIAGCKKNNASLVGTWSFNTQREILKTSNVTTFDTTVNMGSGTMVTFTSGGKYNTTGTIGLDSGTYAQNSGKLTLNSASGSTPMVMLINLLSDHNLTLEQRDTGSSVPVTTAQYIFNLSR